MGNTRRLFCHLPQVSSLFSTSLSVGLLLLLGACSSLQQGSPGSTPDTEVATVTILGAITGEQQQKLEAALAPFVEKTGIEIIYQGTEAFSTLLPVRVEAGQAPDIAIFPQPGLMTEFAEQGDLVPLSRFMDDEQLQQAYAKNWLDLVSVDDEVYGIWYRVAVKSLVWYSPKAFQQAGYQVPQTWEELEKLSETIVKDGGVPWCLGIESGEATGWVGTDWIEDIMLRDSGPDVYDQWVKHEIPFNHPAVRRAFERFGEIALNPKYVVGGTIGVINTPFGNSPNGLFTDPPGCYMHRQAGFITSFFPEGVVLGEDVDLFPLPPIKSKYGTPILVGGDVVSMFNDTPEARQLIRYMTTVIPHEIWAKRGGYISPHQQLKLDIYPDPVSRKQAEILANAEVIRFDASDMMPGDVGTGTFWLGIIDYIEGADVDTILIDIHQSWPKSEESIQSVQDQ